MQYTLRKNRKEESVEMFKQRGNMQKILIIFPYRDGKWMQENSKSEKWDNDSDKNEKD